MSEQGTAQGLTVDVKKNASEVLRISPVTWKGFDLVDVRVFYADADDRLKPTRKGVTFRRSLLGPVIEALERIRQADQGEAE